MKKRIIPLLLVLALLLSFTACGGSKETEDPNLLKIGDYEALYTGCEIVQDLDGEDAVVMHFDFTNNGEEAQSFEWAFYYTVTQGDQELDYALVLVDEENYTFADDEMLTDVEPGQSLEVCMSYKLKDLTTDVVVAVTDLFESESDSVTVDLSAAK